MHTPIAQLLHEPESKMLEFKRDLSSPRPLLKTLVAFANSAGGRLIIGVADDKQIVGVENPLDAEERLCNLIADSISPRLAPNVELVTLQGKTLRVIEVFLSNSRPHWLNAEGSEEGVYVRLGSSNRKADRALITELQRSVQGVSFDEMPMPDLSVDDLDLNAAQQAFASVRRLDEQALLTLKLLTHDQGRLVPTRGSILLFGKQRSQYFSDAWIQCGRFLGTQKLDIFDHIDIDLPLPQAVDEVMLFLKKHAFRGANLSEVRRKDVWSIPLGILREGLINAVVHCDYSQRGAPIRVVFLDDRIEIENPGILLPGLTIEEMKQGVWRIRNHVIARVFRELHLIEQWGTGVRRMYEEARQQGLPEPMIEEVGMRLRLTLYLSKAHKIKEIGNGDQSATQSAIQAVTQSATQSAIQSDDNIARLMRCLRDGEKSPRELREMLGLKHRHSFRENYLHPALKRGMIELTLPDKPNSRLQKYRLSKDASGAVT